jgi:hypothetical protein
MNRPRNCVVATARATEFHNTYSSVHEWHQVLSVLADLSPKAAFLKLWSADHKWSSGSALVVLLD